MKAKFKVGEVVGMTEHRGGYHDIYGDTVTVVYVEYSGGRPAYECETRTTSRGDMVVLFFFEKELTKIK